MIVTPVAYRYARSLMELAQEKGQLAGVNEDMHLVAEACTGSEDLRLLLKSPVIKADTKDKVLDRVFAGRIGEMTSRFMGILVRKGREGLLPEVAVAFTELYQENQNILTAQVTSAVPLSEEARRQVREMAEKKHPGKSIELSEKVDPNLIGGVIIRIGDEQYDGSVSRRLHDLRRKFSENPYIPEI
jgi:F-type H+-transporting ATPase subunit delta